MAILDFLYFGDAQVYQENLDFFLAIAEDLELKGLTGQTSSEVDEEQEKVSKPIPQTKEPFKISPAHKSDVQNIDDAKEASKVIVVTNQLGDWQLALDEKVKSMMEERTKKLIPAGKEADGTPSELQLSFAKCVERKVTCLI